MRIFAIIAAALLASLAIAATATAAPLQTAGYDDYGNFICEDYDFDGYDDETEDWCGSEDENDGGYEDGDGSDDYQTSPGDIPPVEPPAEPLPEPDPTIWWPKPPKGAVAKLRANGRTARAPRSAPAPVKAMIRAANSLTRKPYKWGGGHGRWKDSGYDCSGSVSYVLRAGGLLSFPMVSGGLAKWGKSGKGRWIQIYANKGHVFMVIAGLRFDTSGWGERGPRWRTEQRGTRGFKLRHPAGL